MIDKELEMSKSLCSYLYSKVNCRPYSEYRHNISLFPLFQTPKSNIVNILSTSVRLPAMGRWFLYTIEDNQIMDIKLPIDEEWTCVSDFCNYTKVDMRFILTTNGKLIPRCFIYVIKNPRANNFIFAIKKNGISPLLTEDEAVEDIRPINLNVYYHNVGETFIISSFPDNSRTSLKNRFYSMITAKSAIPKIVFIDGVEITPFDKNGNSLITIADIPDTCVGEIVYDTSIVGSFELDFDGFNHVYLGDGDVQRLLVHIPTSLNPKNEILHSNNCDIYVHPRSNTTNYKGNGMYIDRTKTEKYFRTVTYNDFSVSAECIRIYTRMSSNSNHGTVKVYVRNHHKGISVGKEINYLRSLYMFDDSTIESILLGRDKTVPFWSAKRLEQTKYVKIIDGYFTGMTADTLKECIEGIGYENSANELCRRVQHILISDKLAREFYIPIPICYLDTDYISAHVFINGLLIDEDLVTTRRVKQFLVLKFNDEVELEIGTRISVELFENVLYKARIVTLENGDSITLNMDQEYLIYKKVADEPEDHLIYNRFEFTDPYMEFSESEYSTYTSEEECENGTFDLTITNRSRSGSMDLIVVSKNAYSKIYGVERHMKELNYDILCTHRLVVKAGVFPEVIDGVVEDTVGYRIKVPYLNTNKNLLVYFNGRELIRGLDYELYSIKAKGNASFGQFIVLQNADFIKLVSNTMEVFSVREDIMSLNTGFLTSDNTTSVESRMSYYDKIGAFFIDGKMSQSDKLGDYYVAANCDRPGASYKIRALLPRCLKTILDKYGSVNADKENAVVDYLRNYLARDTEIAPITRSYHLYSVFIQYVTEQILRGKFQFDMSWSDEFIKGRMEQYADMMNFDLCFSDKNQHRETPEEFVKEYTSGLDFRFVDVLPSYRMEKLDDPDLDIVEERPIMILSNCNIPEVNGNYLCVNPGIDYMKDKNSDHTNENTYKIWEHVNGKLKVEHDGEYWNVTDKDGYKYYKARDPKGIKEIWDLTWEPIYPAYTELHINTVYIQVQTANEFPIHRLQYTFDIQTYAFLQRLAKIYIEQDLAKDGMNI